jgi:ribosomal protein S18 acetylase RimI-like enzyme
MRELDNPVWYSLSEVHKDIAIEYPSAKFYHPDYCPFGGFESPGIPADAISSYAKLTNNFFIVGDKPQLPTSLRLANELVCDQMVIDARIYMTITDDIIPLSEEYYGLLSQLVNFVQPGYFKSKTPFLGNYYGIFKENELVAAAGERMKMNDYVEVSAIVTHPDHTRKGYAQQLIAHTVNNIVDNGKTAYLHVAETNTGAIKLYEKLGFRQRRKISFWNITG